MALEQLEQLSKAPLGTPRTAWVQDLVEAILDYEARHGLNATTRRE